MTKAKQSKKISEFKHKHFFHKDKAVQPNKIYSDKVYIEKTLRIGIELESSNISKSSSEFQRLLRANRSYDDTNSYIQRVYNDMTVQPNGVEVVFKGSNECFNVYLQALTKIENTLRKLVSSGVIDNSTASSHITILTDQNREIPDTYLANYYQLYRKFCDALLWLTGTTYEPRETNLRRDSDSTGARLKPNKNRIVRKGIVGQAKPMMIKSPQYHRIYDIATTYGKYYGMFFKDSTDSIEVGDDCLGRQLWLPNKNPNGMCIEFRFPDRNPIPSAIVSIKCLLQGMLFKALELSEFGIMNVEANGQQSWDKTKAMVTKLAVGGKLTTADKKYLTSKANTLIDFVYPNLKSFDGQSIEVLRKLAKLPISLRYARGDTINRIIKDLTPKKSAERMTQKAIRNIIQLQLVKAKSPLDWRKKVSKELGISERAVRHNLTQLGDYYEVRFEKELKSYILVM